MSSNRAAPFPVAGAVLHGTVYVFVPSVVGITKVSFYLDDKARAHAPSTSRSRHPGTSSAPARPTPPLTLRHHQPRRRTPRPVGRRRGGQRRDAPRRGVHGPQHGGHPDAEPDRHRGARPHLPPAHRRRPRLPPAHRPSPHLPPAHRRRPHLPPAHRPSPPRHASRPTTGPVTTPPASTPPTTPTPTVSAPPPFVSTYTWKPIAPVPIGTTEAESVVLDDKLYLFGGFDVRQPR